MCRRAVTVCLCRRQGRGERLLPELSRTLRLSKPQEVAFAIALLHSTDSDTSQQAERFIQQRLPELIKDYIDSGAEGGEVGASAVRRARRGRLVW